MDHIRRYLVYSFLIADRSRWLRERKAASFLFLRTSMVSFLREGYEETSLQGTLELLPLPLPSRDPRRVTC